MGYGAMCIPTREKTRDALNMWWPLVIRIVCVERFPSICWMQLASSRVLCDRCSS
jgi:hypothetical protein